MNYKFVDIPNLELKDLKKDEPKEIFSGNNFIFIAGKPGDGKSTMISTLLRTKNLLAGKYHKVLFITPGDIPMISRNQDDWNEVFDMDWLLGKLR